VSQGGEIASEAPKRLRPSEEDKMTFDFTNKKIVIIGGSAGIGLAAAKALAGLGAQIVIASRSQARLGAATAEIGNGAAGHRLDVTDARAIESFFDTVGPFDHLATTAAIGAIGMFLEIDPAKARTHIESKLWGQYFAARFGAPKLRAGGSITLFSGVVSRKPLRGATTAALATGAIESLTRVLALELAPIRVNCVTPGITATGVWSELLTVAGARDHLERVGSALPVGRVGCAEDVARAVVYLMGNGFATGSVMDVDGGHRVI
jgi:NAD(P)-dependent dehydrogenase (short-subunit alcohol dehydrogenase family)